MKRYSLILLYLICYTLTVQNYFCRAGSDLVIVSGSSGGQSASNTIKYPIYNTTSPKSSILFQENFENSNFKSRSWYDNTSLQLSKVEHIKGSTSSLEFHFLKGANKPVSGAAIRKKISETDELYVSYYIKYSANWEGSNKPYHPHEFYILTNKDSEWSGLSHTYLTVYIEQNQREPLLAIQDGKNIDQTKIGIDLANITENRAVAGCNGDSDGYGVGECYKAGGAYQNGKLWRSGRIYFQDTLGDYYKNDWHYVEVYLKLNSISKGRAVKNGQMNYWFDGHHIINHNDVIFRTGKHPDMKFNQFVIAPWIGDGSPVDQTMWVDDLTVATSR